MGGQINEASVRILHRRDDVRVALTYYEPGDRMPPHKHDYVQLTLLLAGSLREVSRKEEADLTTCARGLKGAGAEHGNVFGPSGALMFSINIMDETLCRDVCTGSWSWHAGHKVREIVSAGQPLQRYFAANDDVARDDLTWDLFSALTMEDACELKVAPAWLMNARDRIREDPGAPALSDLARENGIHPASLSRAFRTAFGESPSTFRQKCRLGLALSRLVRGEGAAQAACAAGFADQSHFSRIARRELGVTPGQLSRLLAAAG